jgi:hypothetical protein
MKHRRDDGSLRSASAVAFFFLNTYSDFQAEAVVAVAAAPPQSNQPARCSGSRRLL